MHKTLVPATILSTCVSISLVNILTKNNRIFPWRPVNRTLFNVSTLVGCRDNKVFKNRTDTIIHLPTYNIIFCVLLL